MAGKHSGSDTQATDMQHNFAIWGQERNLEFGNIQVSYRGNWMTKSRNGKFNIQDWSSTRVALFSTVVPRKAESQKTEKEVLTFGRICKWPKLAKSIASRPPLACARFSSLALDSANFTQ
jgi:hypothetical protein